MGHLVVVAWRSSIMEYGAQCVMIHLVAMKLSLPADNLGFLGIQDMEMLVI